MIRTVLAALGLTVLAALGVVGVWAFYDLMTTYGSTTGSELRSLVTFLPVLGIILVVLTCVAAVVVGVAPQSRRLFVTITAAVILFTSTVGMLVGSHFGHEAKRAEAATPPECGVGNAELDREFRRIDHPGYFGGGSSSTTECSLHMEVEDLDQALADYEESLSDDGYEVTGSGMSVEATRPGFQFSARPDESSEGRALMVTLIQTP